MQASVETVQEGGGMLLVGMGVQPPPVATGTGIRMDAAPASQLAAPLTVVHAAGVSERCAHGIGALQAEPTLETPA
jgi:hypothetical protein